MKLAVALDMYDLEYNLKMIQDLKKEGITNLCFKIGFKMFIMYGLDFAKKIKNIDNNFEVFIDLKFYDIPNTMAEASLELAKSDVVDIFTIHISSGKKSMLEVMNRLNNLQKRPLVAGVTALTSFDNSSFYEIYNSNIDDKIVDFAKLASESQLDCVVCSVWESKKIKENTNLLTITPGIRPFGENQDDQARVATIQEAKIAGSDYVVIGRPIYGDYVKNIKMILDKF